MIIEYKYNGLYDLRYALAYLVVTKIKRLDINLNNIVMIPVPLDKQKLNLRGFDQNELIAKIIQKALKIQVLKILIKNKTTLPQVYIKNPKLRYENIKNAFSIINKHMIHNLKQKTIFLLDDVSTTHATLNECAKVLKKHGLSNIWGITIAKG